MKKIRVLSFILTLMLVLPSLSGCHGSKMIGNFLVPDEFDASRQYEISFWAKNDTNSTQVEIYKKAIRGFQELYPNIKVNLKLYTDYNMIYNDVITNIATGTTPNVCITYPDHIATYLTGENTVVALDDLFENKKYGLGGKELLYDGPTRDEMVDKFLEEGVINGLHYAMPFMRSTEACYINKTYVEKLGYTVPDVLTWDFIFEVSSAAMEKDADGNFKVNGQKVLIPFIYKSTDNMMIQMLKQKGAGYSTESGEILLFNDTTREILDTVASSVSVRAFSIFTIDGYPANFLNAGQCIFAIDSTAGATWMGSDAPLCDISEDKIVQFETVVRTVPQYNVDDPQMISQGPSICVFNKEDGQEVLASWLFAQFLLTNDVQISYAQTEGYVPVTKKAQESDEYIDYLSREGEDNDFYYDIKLKATKLLIENTDNTFVTPVFNGSASLRNAAGQLIEGVTKSVRRKETIDDAYYKKLYADVTALTRIDQIDVMSGEKKDLGKLPTASIALLSVIGGAWLVISGIYVADIVKKRKNRE